jgi:putative hemolysin
MKSVVFALMMAFGTVACAKEEPKKQEPKKEVVAPVENNNCVKKDKNGKCPPLPNSPKPTPKKPAEKK